MSLHLQPLTFAEAKLFIEEHHRHHIPPVGNKFCIGLNDGDRVVGAVVVGRPVARYWDNGYTAEVTRLVVLDGVKNGCSKLYAAAWRAARAMGYTRLITYTLSSESGASLRASGWSIVHQTEGGSWDCAARPRVDKHPTEPKMCWEMK